MRREYDDDVRREYGDAGSMRPAMVQGGSSATEGSERLEGRPGGLGFGCGFEGIGDGREEIEAGP